MSSRSRITIDATSPVRTGCGLLLVLVTLFCGLPVIATLAAGDPDLAEIVTVTLLFFVLPVGLAFGLAVLVVRRTKTYLEGTELVRQSPFRVDRTDLAKATEIYLDSLPDVTADADRRIPVLVVNDPERGVARLRLRTKNGWVPPGQLLALADVIGARQEFRPVADWLRTLATDPDAQVW